MLKLRAYLVLFDGSEEMRKKGLRHIEVTMVARTRRSALRKANAWAKAAGIPESFLIVGPKEELTLNMLQWKTASIAYEQGELYLQNCENYTDNDCDDSCDYSGDEPVEPLTIHF